LRFSNLQLNKFVSSLLLCLSFGLPLCVWAHSGDNEKFVDNNSAGPQTLKVDEQGIRALNIHTVPVVLAKLKESLRATGDVQADQTRAFNVTPTISGIVKQVLVKQGDIVHEGQELAVIQSVEVANSLTQLLSERTKIASEMARVKTQYAADIAIQENQLALAKTTLERDEALFKLGITARKTFQETKNTFDTATVKLASLKQRAEQENSLLSKQLSVTTETARGQLKIVGVANDDIEAAMEKGTVDPNLSIRAPVSGCVVSRQITLGERVDSSKSIFSIVNLSPIWVLVDIYQEQIPRIKINQPVLLETPSKEKLQGSISSIGTIVDSITKTLDVRIITNNEHEMLRPGMFVTAEIILGESQELGMLVPESAVVYYKERPFAYVYEKSESDFVPTELTLGKKAGGQVQVLAGLKPGQMVVSSGGTQLMAQSILKAGEEQEHEGEKHDAHAQHEHEESAPVSPKAELVMGFGLGLGAAIIIAIFAIIMIRVSKKPEGK